MSPLSYVTRRVPLQRLGRAPPASDGSRPSVRPTCLIILLASSFVATSTGCRSDASPVPDDEPSTLTIGMSRVNELFRGGGYERLPVFLPLIAINERGELEGRLAQSWELSPDFGAWTIRIRSDVRWHDGVPVTAHDIKFAADLYQHPDVLRWTPSSREVAVLDDTTFTLAYHSAFVGDETKRWRSAETGGLPRHLLEGMDPRDFYTWDYWKRPIGHGPYRFVRRVPQTMIELEANPDFYLGRPRIDRVIFRQTGATTAELLSGNVDMMQLDPPSVAKQVATDPSFRVFYHYGNDQTLGIPWHQGRYPPFRDRRVRRALTQAIDRRGLLAVLDLPPELAPIYDVLLSHEQFRRGEYPDPVPHDPDAARRLLEEAGWRDMDGDGIRERDGEEFRFTLLARANELEEAVYVQAELRRVGIAVEIAHSAIGSRINADADFEAGIAWFWGELRPGVIRLGRWLGTESPIGYSNPTVDSLILRGRATRDPDEYERIFRELGPIIQQDLPITFLYRTMHAFVAHRRVCGLSSPWRAEPYTYLDQLWLEDEP